MKSTKSKDTLRSPSSTIRRRIVALAGGVGGAKLAHGLAQTLSALERNI